MELTRLSSRFPAASMYLSQILLIERDYGTVSNTRLSKRLKVSKPAVTQSVKRLIKLELLSQDPYGTIKLTPEGRSIAEQVIIRHYLIEHLLIEKLGYPWDKTDEEALLLQGVMSRHLTEHLNETFDHPDRCPHGNPFPGSPAEQELLCAPRLDTMKPGNTVTLIRITEEGEDLEGLLKFCNTHNLRPGRTFTIEELSEPSAAVSCSDTQSTLEIPRIYAQHLCISPEKQ